MTPSAEIDAAFGPEPTSRHAFWGTDPSGYCGCEDCEPTRVLSPGVAPECRMGCVYPPGDDQ